MNINRQGGNEGHRLNAGNKHGISVLICYAFPLVYTPPQNAHAFSRYRLQKASFLRAIACGA